MNKILFILTFGVSLSAYFSVASAAEDVLDDAQYCTVIASRLDRLNCFDALFKTPLKISNPPSLTSNAPPSWQRAFESLSQYAEGDTRHLTIKGDSNKGNAWITLLALNQKTSFEGNAKPVLLMSCIDNLSRVELVFPTAIDDSHVQISMANTSAQSWRSDDSGLLFSSGRGMPAIEMMKAIARQQRLVLRSNSPFVDGLQFDVVELSQSLGALRTRCGW